MASLTETTFFIRKIIKFGSLGLIGFLILWVIVRNLPNPPPPPLKPDIAFGILPAIKFPQKGTNPSYSPKIETVDNKFPTFPNITKVFLIPKQSRNLFTWEKAKNWAAQLGFTGEPQKTDEYNFIYRSETFPQTILKINVLTGNFTLSYNYQNDTSLVGISNAPLKDQAISEAKQFLQRAQVLTSDLESGYQDLTYLRFVPPDLEKAVSVSEADFVLVNFFRGEIESIKVLPPDSQKSLVSVLVSGSEDSQKKILEVNYTHYSVNLDSPGTYPLKPINTAWKELEGNQAFLANFGQNLDGIVTIRKVYLAYFDPPDEQTYLQPVYVFEGDRDFLAYIPALDPTYTKPAP